MSKATLNNQHEYITLRMPNGNFTVSFNGYKASGGIVQAGTEVFKRFVKFVDEGRKTKSIGEVMQELTDETVLSSLWQDWDKVIKNPFKVGNRVVMPKKMNYGAGEIYKVTKKNCGVVFKREGRIIIPFSLLQLE